MLSNYHPDTVNDPKDDKAVCHICTRKYKLFPAEETSLLRNSRVELFLRCFENPPRLRRYDICPTCAWKVHMAIYRMMMEAPKKCDFCQFERGPKHPEYPHPNCKDCTAYSNFQVKKRMSERQKYEWALYNGEV